MKKTWVRKTLSVGVLAAGALLLAPAAAAQADVDQVTYGNIGALNGTQIAVPVKVPVNVVGNAVSVLGVAHAQGTGINKLESARTESILDGGGDGVGSVDQVSAGNFGALNGTQIAVPITVPINACGNSLAVVGVTSANAFCANIVGGGHRVWKLEGKKQKRTESGLDGGGDGVGSVDQVSAGNFGLANGTQIAAPITIPINACGNSLAVLGLASANGTCVNYLGSGHGNRKHIHWVKPVKPIWPGDVIGDGGGLGGDCGPVKGIVKGHGHGHGYGCDDDGDVRGDQGYNDDQDVKDDGYGK